MTEETRGQLYSMETIILAITISTLNVVCFLVGASVRQKVDKGKEVNLPNVNPVDWYREHQKKKGQEKKANQREVLLHNIEVYNGTSLGQEDIPR